MKIYIYINKDIIYIEKLYTDRRLYTAHTEFLAESSLFVTVSCLSDPVPVCDR